MEKVTTPEVFAEILRVHRERFNLKFEAARLKSPALDGALFLEHLSTRVAPLVEAIHARDETRAVPAAFALYDVLLELFSKNLMGAAPRSTLTPRLWEQLFPVLGNLLTERVLRAVVNAVVQIEDTPGTRGAQWVDEMSTLALKCDDGDDFLNAGKILAWRCGMAHLRASALCAARELAQKSPMLALGALGGDATTAPAQLIAAYESDLWFSPQAPRAQNPEIQKIIGAFCGLEKDGKVGAVFLQPPRVCVHDGNFYAFDEENLWLFYADYYGASFHHVGALMEFSGDPHAPSYSSDAAQNTGIPGLSDPSSVARSGSTLAVTLPHSHAIYLVA